MDLFSKVKIPSENLADFKKRIAYQNFIRIRILFVFVWAWVVLLTIYEFYSLQNNPGDFATNKFFIFDLAITILIPIFYLIFYLFKFSNAENYNKFHISFINYPIIAMVLWAAGVGAVEQVTGLSPITYFITILIVTTLYYSSWWEFGLILVLGTIANFSISVLYGDQLTFSSHSIFLWTGINLFAFIGTRVSYYQQKLNYLNKINLEKTNKSLQKTIEERIVIESELQEAKHKLEERVAERTQELTKLNSDLEFEIKERISVLNALKESENRLKRAFNNAGLGMALVEKDGHLIWGNDFLYRLLGYEISNLEKIHFTEIIYPEDSAKTEPLRQELIEAKMPYFSIELRLIHKNGSVVWVLWSESLIRDQDSKIINHFLSITDITDWKHSESERFLFAYALKSINDMVTILDLKLRVISVNQAVENLLGFKQDELQGKSGKILYADSLSDHHFRKMLTQSRKGGWQGELMLRSKKGEDIPVSMSANALRNDEGEIIAYIGVGRDIRERRELEHQLNQSQKMEAVGRLAGGVAHDFNNILTVINGYSDIILTSLSIEDDLHHHISEIRKAGKRASLLTDQLLVFSRKQVLQPEILNVNEIVRDLEKMLKRLIGEDISLRLNLDTKKRMIKVDRGQMDQVIMNLVVNARDAMPNGGTITIESTLVEIDSNSKFFNLNIKPGKYVLLKISDTGVGMNKNIQNQIFEPFFTTKKKGKGTGLGLSTVYGIIKQSGGHISVYSEENVGSIFKIYLPEMEKENWNLDKKQINNEIYKGNELILIVEDEEAVRRLASTSLKSFGYRVMEAENGEIAINLVKDCLKDIDLLLTDVIMPGMSGKELVDNLREKREDLPVLFMSGYTADVITEKGILAKDISLLQKPYSPLKLAKTVREVLDQVIPIRLK